MSLLSAMKFLHMVEMDTELQLQMNTLNWNAPKAASFAAQHGLHFSAQDFQSAVDTLWGVLDEEQLSHISGGKGPGSNFPHDNPPPGHSGREEGGTWSPPPGDVSGNSCFFGWKGGK
jgi:hypothetical protein